MKAGRSHCEVTAKGGGTFAHPKQTEGARVSDGVGTYACHVFLNLENHLIVVCGKGDAYRCRLGVASHVRERFLENAEDARGSLRGEVHDIGGKFQPAGDAAPAAD